MFAKHTYTRDRYKMAYICNYENLVKTGLDQTHIELLKKCDIFIYQPFNKKHTESEYDISNLKTYLKPECFILRANYYRFKGFWYESDYVPYTNYKHYAFGKSPYCSLHKSFIGFKGGMEEIVRKIDSISIDNEAFMAYFNEQIDQFKILDGNSDVKMTEYLLNNYKTKRLFHDVWHPTNLFLYEVFRQLVRKIDAHELLYEDMAFISHFDNSEMTHWASPILPIIETYLGLEQIGRAHV
jgi:hypothetical protein